MHQLTEPLSEEEKLKRIEENFAEILQLLGLDLSHPWIRKTPERLAKMYSQEILYGLKPENFPALSDSDFFPAENEGHSILIKDIAVNALCAHHFLPFIGSCSIGYIPKKKILGLSKFNRIVDFYCRRPQLQENLTKDLLHIFSTILETDDIAVQIKARHLCVAFRGIRDQNSETLTQSFKGKFFSDETLRKEFISSLSY